MAITVVTPATYTAFCLLAEVKAELRITDTTDDAMLTILIAEAGSIIETLCGGRTFALERVTETMAGHGGDTLILTRRPITTIHSVEYDSVEVDSDLYEIGDADTGQLVTRYGWYDTTLWVQDVVNQPLAGAKALLYDVDYTAGYYMADDEDATPTLPQAVQRVAKDIVISNFLTRGSNKNLKSEKLLDAAYAYMTRGEMYADVRKQLSHWVLS